MRYEILSSEESPRRPADDVAEKEKEKEMLAKLKEEKMAKPAGVSNVGYGLFLTLAKT